MLEEIRGFARLVVTAINRRSRHSYTAAAASRPALPAATATAAESKQSMSSPVSQPNDDIIFEIEIPLHSSSPKRARTSSYQDPYTSFKNVVPDLDSTALG
jgi:hypothetical protein